MQMGNCSFPTIFSTKAFAGLDVYKRQMLNSYLADIDEQAEDMFFRLVKQMSEREGVTEEFKVNNQLEWVQKMNSIRNRAMEIVNVELIFI